MRCLEKESKGIILAIIGVVFLIIGLWLKNQIWITDYYVQPFTGIKIVTDWISMEPFGILSIIAGTVATILGVWLLTLAAREPKLRKKRTLKTKKEQKPAISTLAVDLKFGSFFIAAGFIIWFLFTRLLAKEYSDPDMVISIGEWLLVIFLIIGTLGIIYGAIDHLTAKKKT